MGKKDYSVARASKAINGSDHVFDANKVRLRHVTENNKLVKNKKEREQKVERPHKKLLSPEIQPFTGLRSLTAPSKDVKNYQGVVSHCVSDYRERIKLPSYKDLGFFLRSVFSKYYCATHSVVKADGKSRGPKGLGNKAIIPTYVLEDVVSNLLKQKTPFPKVVHTRAGAKAVRLLASPMPLAEVLHEQYTDILENLSVPVINHMTKAEVVNQSKRRHKRGKSGGSRHRISLPVAEVVVDEHSVTTQLGVGYSSNNAGDGPPKPKSDRKPKVKKDKPAPKKKGGKKGKTVTLTMKGSGDYKSAIKNAIKQHLPDRKSVV